MATRRWLGGAADIAQVDTCTVGGTWVAGDKITLTIANIDVVVTIGSLVTTAQVATTVKQAFNAEAFTDTTASVSPTGGAVSVPQFAEIVATVSSNVVTLTGRTAGKPFTLTSAVTSAAGTFSKSSSAATGKNFFDNQDNWSANTVPVDNDDIVFDSGNVDCLYGLSPAIQPASVTITLGYSGKIGLKDVNTDSYNYPEYRTQYLTFDNNSVTTTYTIGSGAGAGSSRIKIDAGAGQVVLNLYGSGSRETTGVPSVLFKGTHASNVANVKSGDLGVAFYAGDTSTIATMTIGFTTIVTGDSTVYCGSGATLTTITKDGGSLTVNSNVTTLTNNGGDVSVDAGAITTLAVRSGTVSYNSTGTLTTASVSGNGHLDFSKDQRAKTVTNAVDMYGTASKLSDPYKVVSTLLVDLNEEVVSTNLNIGRHIRLTRGNPA